MTHDEALAWAERWIDDWNKQDYETFKEYETKTDRKIPVVILEPVG